MMGLNLQTINGFGRLQYIKWKQIMKDNSDIPLPTDQIKSKVLVFAIIDEASHEYQQITKGYVQLSTDQDQHNNTFHYLQVKDQLTHDILMRSNLKLQNNFGKQKGSIISWTDDQQPQYQEIALSFQKENQCEMFWRVICDKIGKNYLEINGTQKLDLPNPNNLGYILQKTKNSIDLIDYNIVHAGSIMMGLKQIFKEMKQNNDQMGMGTVVRIINSIMSPNYSSGAIQTFLIGDNFQFLLEVQEFKKGIRFSSIYQQKVGRYLRNKFQLPRQIFEKIEVSHRAIFYRQNVLDLVEDSVLESMMLMIVKQCQVQIMSYLNRQKFLQKLINMKQYPKSSQDFNNQHQQDSISKYVHYNEQHLESGNIQGVKEGKISKNEGLINEEEKIGINEVEGLTVRLNEGNNRFEGKTEENNRFEGKNEDRIEENNEDLQNDKIDFMHEALIMYQQITSQQLKSSFKQNIYSCGMMEFVKSMIQKNNIKALQILYCISQMDKSKLFGYVIQQFKCNSSDNLLKTLMKKYINQEELIKPIIAIIESLGVLFNERKQLVDFFLGTFVYSVMTVCKEARSILILCNLLLCQLSNCSMLLSQIIKCKVCEKLANQYRNGTSLKSKIDELQLVKFLKYILVELIHKDKQIENKKEIEIDKEKEIEKILIESGLLDCCMMIYLKHSRRNNIISSSMLENIKLIQKIQHSHIHSYLLKQYSTNQYLTKLLQLLKNKYIQSLKNYTQSNLQYIQTHTAIHQSILQNQSQQNYLMNDNHQLLQYNNGHHQILHINDDHQIPLINPSSLPIDQNNHHSITQQSSQNTQSFPYKRQTPSSQSQKQTSILFLTQIMTQITQPHQYQLQSKSPRKIVKKSQNQNQAIGSFVFDLPDIDQLQYQINHT